MTEKEYRSSDGISRSELWKIRESPEKFKWWQEHPEPATPALVFGQLVHKMLLEPDTFKEEFEIAPDVDRRTKAGKAEFAAFLEKIGDKTPVSEYDKEKAEIMAEKVWSMPFVEKLLSGEHEKPLMWIDDLTGELCKVRLDCLTEIGDHLIIVDYKTTADARSESFMRSAIKYGYDFQAAMYCEAVEKAIGKRPIFVFIAQEKEEPFAVNLFKADEKFITHGYDTFRELIGIYHDCKVSGNWWGYLGKDNSINDLGLPRWIEKEEE